MLASSLTGWRTVEEHCSQFENTVVSVCQCQRLDLRLVHTNVVFYYWVFFFLEIIHKIIITFIRGYISTSFFMTLYLGIRLLISEVDDYLTLLWNSEIVSSVVCTSSHTHWMCEGEDAQHPCQHLLVLQYYLIDSPAGSMVIWTLYFIFLLFNDDGVFRHLLSPQSLLAAHF